MLERLLDSVILIDHFNNIGKATDFILSLDPRKTAISVISRAEILAGFDDESIEQAKSLLDQFVLLTIQKDIADETASLRRKYHWKLNNRITLLKPLRFRESLFSLEGCGYGDDRQRWLAGGDNRSRSTVPDPQG